MAKQVEQQLMFCKNEQRNTLFYRNSKSRNWILHIILALFTGGLWLVVMLFLALTSGGKGKWACSQCGTAQK